MGNSDGNDKLSKNPVAKNLSAFPEIFVDHTSDFASIKIRPGIESKSYIKDGIVISEDKNGDVIEIQILNISAFNSQKSAS